LYHQQKYQDAEEMFRQAMQGREKAIGGDHPDTLDSKRLLQNVLRVLGLPPLLNYSTTVLTNRLDDFFSGAEGNRDAYIDSEIYEIAALLKQVNFR
ncbi:hypothetical protein K469DRAFT_578010, partial [Zopfia rhizophila CBS 207.26]